MSERTVSVPPRERRRPTPRARARGPLRRLFEWLLVLLTLAALAATLATAAVLLGERGLAQRIYPHISVRGVPVGGLDRDAARRAIARRYASFLYSPVSISYGAQIWRPSAEELGVSLDVDGAVGAALAIGREDERADNLRTAAAVWDQGVDLPLRLLIDQAAMQRYLLGLATSVEVPPTNADVALADAQILVRPEAWGIQVMVDETIAEITAAAQALDPQPVVLRTRALEPRVRDADMAPAVARLRTLLDGPISLSSPSSRCAPGCGWAWPTTQIAGWLSLRHTTGDDGRPAVAVSVDQGAIRSALMPVAAALREEGTLPRIDWNDGALRIATPGDPGRGLDASQALAQINAALGGGPRAIRLPLVALPPPVNETNLASLGITAQVGLGLSSFSRSEQYRITNIRAGARQMNGVLIPPGGTFSFNDNLGPVTAENGFVEGYAIIQNRTQKEWGGGLCQVSTTVFRAAFWGGLPIVERHEHSFRISWYEELGEPPGLDAAIFTGVQDMRFTNDTGG
ncbi:VanW family protein [Oscillochloris sp. ZM17-4]|uniref:VanW family protein n=1 Tax=Oscillochloris sp. ZM17-4 TaxID=2866714 RepID=UPI001C730808|nr:VanW family protein [Oscillochloris sp. ZM17-4]MBX0330141.1 VanW family protein [Oscillochloris sp. ZM17-4]